MTALRRLLRARWNLLRLAAAAVLLWVLVADTPARLARLQYASLPGFDAAAEVRYLRAAGRFGEAIMIADAAMEQSTKHKSQTADPKERDAIQARIDEVEVERRRTLDEQGSYLRRATDLGLGAVSGTGGSLERLVGAVAADFFIVGDLRDLVLQGGRLVIDGETDEVILVLSGVGLATTLVPEIDWVPSILKAARRAGTMTKGLSEFILRSVRSGKIGDLRKMLGDVRILAVRTSPGGAVQLLKHADSPEDVAALARFVERQPGAAGGFALHVTGKEGADLVKASSNTAEAGAAAAKSADDVILGARSMADDAVVLAAQKGPGGVAWLRTGAYRVMLRPHPIVGILKGVYKGNAAELARRIAAALDPRARWLIPLLAAWVFVELALLASRLRGQRTQPVAAPA